MAEEGGGAHLALETPEVPHLPEPDSGREMRGIIRPCCNSPLLEPLPFPKAKAARVRSPSPCKVVIRDCFVVVSDSDSGGEGGGPSGSLELGGPSSVAQSPTAGVAAGVVAEEGGVPT